jgi:glycerophosphoryl diester phosphodiesterase
MKSGSASQAVAEMTRIVHQAEHPVPVKISSQDWTILRLGGNHSDAVELFFSVDDVAKLTLLLSVARDEPRIEGCSVAQWLVDRPRVEALRDRGLKVFVWTVDDPQRARQLVDWGVDGIITNTATAIRAAARQKRLPPEDRAG